VSVVELLGNFFYAMFDMELICYCVNFNSAWLDCFSGRVQVIVRDPYTRLSQICVETTPRVLLTLKAVRGRRTPVDSAFLIIAMVSDVTNDVTRNADEASSGVKTSEITTIENGGTIVCRLGTLSMSKNGRRQNIRRCRRTTASIKSRRDA
jgi:hypothetical protein